MLTESSETWSQADARWTVNGQDLASPKGLIQPFSVAKMAESCGFCPYNMDSEGRGHWFESSRVHHSPVFPVNVALGIVADGSSR